MIAMYTSTSATACRHTYAGASSRSPNYAMSKGAPGSGHRPAAAATTTDTRATAAAQTYDS
jgi:hypothetical protein